MTDIVRVADEYYVRASSALADDRTRVLKSGDTFLIANRYGDIEALGTSQFGLFHAESRHLSRFSMRLNRLQPLLLSSVVREDNAFLAVDLTNFDSPPAIFWSSITGTNQPGADGRALTGLSEVRFVVAAPTNTAAPVLSQGVALSGGRFMLTFSATPMN